MNSSKQSYTYDANNNNTEQITQFWDGTKWVNGFRNLNLYFTPTTIENGVNIVDAYSLSDNYPNPFNPSTTIKFQIPNAEFVNLKIFNVIGQEVTTLIANNLDPGSHSYQFDGKNLASGIYYYQLVAGEFREVKKMILLR